MVAFRELRQAAGLTQAGLAEKSGVNIRQIRKIEAGDIRIGNITLTNAARLAAALGVRIEDLLNCTFCEKSQLE